MKKFEMWFGKDPEELEFDCYWPDSAKNTDEFKSKYVAEIFATDDEDEFWKKFVDVNSDPVAMWYWVIINGVTHISGAIDPDDIYRPIVPELVRKNILNRRISK